MVEDHFSDEPPTCATVTARAATASDVVDRARAVLDDVEDLFVGHPLADADDHCRSPPSILRMIFNFMGKEQVQSTGRKYWCFGLRLRPNAGGT
jgi:hypothetical protein